MSDPHAPRRRRSEFRFYEELNDFLPQRRRRRSFEHEFTGTPAVRDVLESLGVPHGEIDLVLVDGEPVAFSHRLTGGERVAVYPVFERFDISPSNRLRPRPLRRTRFVLDVHLGKLARLLRLAGFDCAYRNDLDDLEIVRIAGAERRTILTRDLALLKHGSVTHGYWLRSTDPPAQLREVVESFQLRGALQPFTRCMECNGRIRSAERASVAPHIPVAIAHAFDAFWQCDECARVYWRGSHFERLEALLADLA